MKLTSAIIRQLGEKKNGKRANRYASENAVGLILMWALAIIFVAILAREIRGFAQEIAHAKITERSK